MRAHRARRRAAARLQPGAAVHGAGRWARRRRRWSCTRRTGPRGTTSTCAPASPRPRSTAPPGSSAAPTGPPCPYDELVLATGSRAFRPPLDGIDRPERRRVPRPRRLRAHPRPGPARAPGSPCSAAGCSGCEAARGLAGRGVATVLVHPMPHLMERQLDADGGAVLAATLGRLGVDVRLGTRGVAWEPGAGLRCADGSLVAADALVVAAGVRAETGLAAAAGIAVDGGVLVDDRLATSDPHVHAIGDCARHPGAGFGLVQPAWEQAAVLADLLTGADPGARYRGTRTVTRLKARDVDLATVGEPAALDGRDGGGRGAPVRRPGRRAVRHARAAPRPGGRRRHDRAAGRGRLHDPVLRHRHPGPGRPARAAVRPRPARRRGDGRPGTAARRRARLPLQHRDQGRARRRMAGRGHRRGRARPGDPGRHRVRELRRRRARDLRVARRRATRRSSPLFPRREPHDEGARRRRQRDGRAPARPGRAGPRHRGGVAGHGAR